MPVQLVNLLQIEADIQKTKQFQLSIMAQWMGAMMETPFLVLTVYTSSYAFAPTLIPIGMDLEECWLCHIKMAVDFADPSQPLDSRQSAATG